MQFYKSYLQDLGKTVYYISATDSNSDIRRLLEKLIGEGIQEVHLINPVDNWLENEFQMLLKISNLSFMKALILLISSTSILNFSK